MREELKKTNKARIEAEKKEYEMRLETYKQNIKIKYEELLNKKKEEIK